MPKTYVTRSIDIEKPASAVYPLISEFRNWPKWSPWIVVEPEAKLTFAPDGSAYSWNGKVIGAGSIERVSENPPTELMLTLKILKPWKSTSEVGFSLEETDSGCTVTWTMDGALPLPLFWMKGMIEGMVGMDYQRGLMMLKDLAETGTLPSKSVVIESEPFSGFSYVGIRKTCAIAEVGPEMEKDFGRMASWSLEEGITPSAPPFSIYHDWNMGKGTCRYTLGYPVENIPSSLPDDMISGELEACDTYVVEHTGPYRHLGNAWSIAMIHARNKIFPKRKGRDPFEIYVSDPRSTPEHEIVTRIHFPRQG